MYVRILSKGTGIPLVFLHGFLGCSQDWRRIVSHLKHRICFAYDLPGHGKTAWTEMDIIDLLSSALPPEPIDLVGHSLGGRLAMRFAFQNPSRIHSLTLLSTHYGLSSFEEKQERLQADRLWIQKILAHPFDEFLRAWYDQPVFSSMKENVALQQEILKMRKTERPKDLARALMAWSLGRQDDHRDELQNYSQPTRIFYGKNDRKFADLYADFPQATPIENCGHSIHLEAPKKIAEILA